MNKTLKTILIFLLIGAIVTGGILGYNWIQKMMDYNIGLTIQKVNLEKLLAETEAERNEAYISVDSLLEVIDEKDKEVDIKNAEISDLTDSLEQIPIIVEQLPPSDSYDSLQTIFVDTVSVMKYRFSGGQVQDIYVEVLTNRVLKDINQKLIDTNYILQEQVNAGKELTVEFQEIIAGYEETNAALIEHVNSVGADNIRIRTQRNIFAGVSGGALFIIALIIAL